jgi:1,4-dihydroxy-2-naphthoyl-CoA synthase
MAIPQLTTIAIELSEGIAEIRLNRPERSNAMNEAMWQELRTAFSWADATGAVHVAILSGAGRISAPASIWRCWPGSPRRSRTPTRRAAARRCGG